MSKPAGEHQRLASESVKRNPVICAVLSVSDTRTIDDDEGGALIVKHLTDAGHVVAARAIVRDEPPQILAQIEQWLSDVAIHAMLITGGTGIARRDTTIEVVRRLLTIELEGFGELFRMLSYQQVGAAAMLSRAVAGLIVRDSASPNDQGTLVFCMPGSPNAVELAMSRLIAPQLAHLVWERRR